jgi:hypothetical protein
MAVKRILVVSDLHHGSIYGMLPPNFELSSGQIIQQNAGQKYLWECWLDMCRRVREDIKPDAVVLNGEPVDGPQQAQRGTELCIPIPKDQGDAAAISLSLLLDATGGVPFYVVQGTEYHDEKVGQACDAVADRLGAVRYKGRGPGRVAKRTLNLRVDGYVLNFHHGIPSSGALYRAVAIDREAVWSAIAGKEGKSAKAEVIIRSHVHFYVAVKHASKQAVITPAWQLQTGFMGKNSEYRMIPDIGFIWIEIDAEWGERGYSPIHIQACLYKLPKDDVNDLEILKTKKGVINGNGGNGK